MAEVTEKAEVSEKKSGGSNILLIIIAVMLFLVLAGGSVGAYLLLNEDDAVISDANQAKQSQSVKEAPVTKKTTTTSSSQRKTDYAHIGKMYPLDPFIVNLFSENGSRYLKTAINLELGNEELGVELDSKKPLIRDIIIKALSAKSYEEISTIQGKENLKDEIVANINEVLEDGKINNVFFTNFVIQ